MPASIAVNPWFVSAGESFVLNWQADNPPFLYWSYETAGVSAYGAGPYQVPASWTQTINAPSNVDKVTYAIFDRTAQAFSYATLTVQRSTVAATAAADEKFVPPPVTP